MIIFYKLLYKSRSQVARQISEKPHDNGTHVFCGGETEQTMIIANKISVIFEDNYLPFTGGSRVTNGRQGLWTCVHDVRCSVSLTEEIIVCNVEEAFLFLPNFHPSQCIVFFSSQLRLILTVKMWKSKGNKSPVPLGALRGSRGRSYGAWEGESGLPRPLLFKQRAWS